MNQRPLPSATTSFVHQLYFPNIIINMAFFLISFPVSIFLIFAQKKKLLHNRNYNEMQKEFLFCSCIKKPKFIVEMFLTLVNDRKNKKKEFYVYIFIIK